MSEISISKSAASQGKTPVTDHVVFAYKNDSWLVQKAVQYIAEGIAQDETCIILATPLHIADINFGLQARGIDTAAAMYESKYLVFDATQMLGRLMRGELVDRPRFFGSIGMIVSLATGRGCRVRAFSELSAVLCGQQNTRAALQLERYSHELITNRDFALHVAYPRQSLEQDAHLLDELRAFYSVIR